MAQTLVSLIVHVIFSTKNREPFITPDIEPELFAYIGGILKNHESRLLDAGGRPIIFIYSSRNRRIFRRVH